MSDIDKDDEYIDIRQELEIMTHAELVAEVISRIKDQRKMLVDNWHENKKLKQEVQDSRKFITDTADQIQKWEDDVALVIAKGLYWKRSFYFLLFLVSIMFILTLNQR
ncbi:hypothetical protein P256_00067 [Acinetobacter nectaris CIP 110549]|uniref:Uncharacterized protein n=1 Tax=Acinetobacter nectaris CIP 110549 TaxID=1392540 RepID=V2TU64_9GAMM|nr:hypothetical protein [Acinetobacter nectaris]ESK41082.1 hypothetical protein P256_00067 [Acinetobacter nectaris CIP 110549]